MTATTQNGIQSAIMPLIRRYHFDQMYNLKIPQGCFAIVPLFGNMKALHTNTCCQAYYHKNDFAACRSNLNTKGDSLDENLDDFVHEFGAHEHLTFDGFQSQVDNNTKFFKDLRKYNIDHHVSAPQRPIENPAEGAIREIKRHFYRVMQQMKLPKRVWE